MKINLGSVRQRFASTTAAACQRPNKRNKHTELDSKNRKNQSENRNVRFQYFSSGSEEQCYLWSFNKHTHSLSGEKTLGVLSYFGQAQVGSEKFINLFSFFPFFPSFIFWALGKGTLVQFLLFIASSAQYQEETEDQLASLFRRRQAREILKDLLGKHFSFFPSSFNTQGNGNLIETFLSFRVHQEGEQPTKKCARGKENEEERFGSLWNVNSCTIILQDVRFLSFILIF